MPAPDSTTYDFDESARAGSAGEARVAAHLREHGFQVTLAATLAEQFAGIDMYATSQEGECRSLEVKTDRLAHRTGNAAVETVSNDRTGRPGWIHTTTADFILYLVEVDDVLYWPRPDAMRAELPAWERSCRRFAAPNRGYRTLGLLVPLSEFERVADRAVSL